MILHILRSSASTKNGCLRPATTNDYRRSSSDPKSMFTQITRPSSAPQPPEPTVKKTEERLQDVSEVEGTTSDECAALTRQIHNDNFNIKLKVHMINKMLDEGSPASPQLLKDLGNMESKMMQSQQRYERLEKKIQLKKRRKRAQKKSSLQKEQRQLAGWKGKGVSSTNVAIHDHCSSSLEDLSFSAIEREHNAVERKFQEALGPDIFTSKTPTRETFHFINQPRPFTLNLTQSTTPPRQLSPPDSNDENVNMMDSPPHPRKITRFASTTNSVGSNSPVPMAEAPHTPDQHKWKIPDLKTRRQTPAHLAPAIQKLDELSLSDTEDDRPIFQFSKKSQPMQSSSLPKGDIEEFQRLQRLVDIQKQELAEKTRKIERLESVIRENEKAASRKAQSPPAKQPAASENTTYNTVYCSALSTFPNDLKLLINEVIAELTQVYDVTRKLPGMPHDAIFSFQDCLLELAEIAQETATAANTNNLPTNPKTSAPPLTDASAAQQLLLFQYELSRQNLAVADLQFINSLQSRQIKTYQMANKTRIQFLRSLGLLPQLPPPPPPTTGFMFSRRNRELTQQQQDTRPRSKGADRFRAVVYSVMAAWRFRKRLDIRIEEKQELKRRLHELNQIS